MSAKRKASDKIKKRDPNSRLFERGARVMHLYHLIDEKGKYTGNTLTIDPLEREYNIFANMENKVHDVGHVDYTFGRIGPKCRENILVKVHRMLDAGPLSGQEKAFRYWKEKQKEKDAETKSNQKMPADSQIASGSDETRNTTLTQLWGPPTNHVSATVTPVKLTKESKEKLVHDQELCEYVLFFLLLVNYSNDILILFFLL